MYKVNCNWKIVTDLLGGKHIKKLTVFESAGGDRDESLIFKEVVKDCYIDKNYTHVVFIELNPLDPDDHTYNPSAGLYSFSSNNEISKPMLIVESFCRISPRRYFVSLKPDNDCWVGLLIQLKDKL